MSWRCLSEVRKNRSAFYKNEEDSVTDSFIEGHFNFSSTINLFFQHICKAVELAVWYLTVLLPLLMCANIGIFHINVFVKHQDLMSRLINRSLYGRQENANNYGLLHSSLGKYLATKIFFISASL